MEELLLLAHERQMVFSYVTERFGTADLPEQIDSNSNFEGLRSLVDSRVPFGYYVLYVPNENEGTSEPLEIGVVQKFHDSLSFLVSKEYSLGLKIKYQEDFSIFLDEVGAKQERNNERGLRKQEEKRQKKIESKNKSQADSQAQIEDKVEKKQKI